MKLRAKPAPAPPPTLVRQKDDFTAEGSPPPGKVATEPPLTPEPPPAPAPPPPSPPSPKRRPGP